MSASFFLCHDYIQACVCAIFMFLYPFFSLHYQILATFISLSIFILLTVKMRGT
jgi:hypothetical protein